VVNLWIVLDMRSAQHWGLSVNASCLASEFDRTSCLNWNVQVYLCICV